MTNENPNAEVYWQMPNGGTPDNVTWDQIFSPDGATECGFWYQVDFYPKDKIEQLTADGVLKYGEDHGIAISWRFEYAGDCVPVEPTPTPTPTPEPTPEATPTPTPTPTPEVPTVITPAEPPAAPPTQTVTTVDQAASDVPVLAETGVGDIFTGTILGTVLLAAGTLSILHNKGKLARK